MVPIADVVEKEKDGIIWRYRDQYGTHIPEHKMKDIFYLFDLYYSQVSEPPVKNQELTEA